MSLDQVRLGGRDPGLHAGSGSDDACDGGCRFGFVVLGAFLCLLCIAVWVLYQRGAFDGVLSGSGGRSTMPSFVNFSSFPKNPLGSNTRSRTNPLAADDHATMSSFTPPLPVPSNAAFHADGATSSSA